MKQKISVSLDMKTISKVEQTILNGKFRNKSHLIEYAVNEYLRGSKNE